MHNIEQQQNYCLGHFSVPFNPTTTSCADWFHAIIGSPDPMDILSYNILQCSIILPTISSLLCCHATEASECSCDAAITLTPPHGGRAVVMQQQIFNHLTEAGFRSFAVAVPMLFSSILGY
jgi:hypothetical protein